MGFAVDDNGDLAVEIVDNEDFLFGMQWQPGGQTIDLTGWSLELQVRHTPTSAPIFDLQTPPGSGITLDGPGGSSTQPRSQGWFTVMVTASQLLAVDPVQGAVWDLIAHDPSTGRSYRITGGSFTIDAGATHP